MICNRRALFFSITLIALPAIITTAAHAQNATQTTSVVTANTRFAFKLFDALTTKKSGQSMLVAPTGMSLIFALLDNVADAEARKEIEEAFEFTGLSLEQVNEGFSALRESIQIAPPKNDDTTKVDDACRVEAHPGCPSKRHCDSRFDLVESRHPEIPECFHSIESALLRDGFKTVLACALGFAAGQQVGARTHTKRYCN